MKTRLSRATVLVPLIVLSTTFLVSSEHSPAPPAVTGKYIGAAKCKNCHSSEDTGDAYGVWSEARHSHAFEALKTPEAKELASKSGVEDPAENDACVKCHVTGFGEPADSFARGFKQEAGVQCETCHGGGEDHMKTRFKAAATGGKSKDYEPLPEGEMIVSPGVEVCVKCHNPESPSYKPFCYFEARAEIAHLDPRKPRTDEEKTSYGKCPSGDPCQHADGCPDGKCNLKPEELAAFKQ
jgi:hypothetical protein